jgi:hypothetical protein
LCSNEKYANFEKIYLNESLTAVNTAVSATARFEKFTQCH